MTEQLQTPRIVANTPAGTQAAMLRAVIAAPHPRIALPTIASHFDVTLADLQTILKRHGYPDATRMRRAAESLTAEAVELVDQADTSVLVVDERRADGVAAIEDRRLARVAVTDLRPDPGNLREHIAIALKADSTSGHHTAADDIEQLADSIREVGLLQPIVARRDHAGTLIVVAGHRRLAAIQRLQWTHVDVIIRPPMRPDDVIAAMLIENGQRRDLDPIEEARGIRKLKAELDITDLDLARKIGRSQSYVSGRLALLNLTPDEQEALRSGDLGLTGGTNLGRLKAGKVRQGSKGNISIPHYGPTHDLAPKAAARCKRLGHGRKLNGGVACGPCWDSVLRADERDHLQETNARRDDCITCGGPLEREAGARA